MTTLPEPSTFSDFLASVLDRLERLERHAGLVRTDAQRGCRCGMPECGDPPQCACHLDVGCQLHDAATSC